MNWLIIILVVLVAIYILFVLAVKALRQKWSMNDRKFFNVNWERISDMNDWKHALLEADKLLDVMLRKRGYQGSLGDKLKKHALLFSDLDAVWNAHKLRNKLAHELDFQLKDKQFKQAMSAFRRAFQDLDLL